MMLINTIEYIHRTYKHPCEFFVELKTKKDYDRLVSSVDSRVQVRRLPMTKKRPYRSPLDTVWNLKVKQHDQINDLRKLQPDMLLVLGGDDLSEYYKSWTIIFDLYRFKSLSRFTKVVLLGQTIGPFYSWRKQLIPYIFKDITIFLRDPLSYDYLNKLGLTDIHSSTDLAFLELPHQKEGTKVLSKYKLQNKQYITLVPSGLWKHYTDNLEAYLDGWQETITMLLADTKLRDASVVIHAHVIAPKKVDDRVIIEKLLKRIPKKDHNRIIAVTDELLPYEARTILGNGILTITGRMHAAVSTLQMTVPAVALSYSVKYKGVIGGTMKSKDLIIEARDNELWQSGRIAKQIEETMHYVLANRSKLTKRISETLVQVKKDSLKQISQIEGLL